jgi:hypothetical protein
VAPKRFSISRRRVVGDPCHQAGRRRVIDRDRDVLLLTQREGLRHLPAHQVAGPTRQERKVARGDDNEADVVDERDKAQDG